MDLEDEYRLQKFADGVTKYLFMLSFGDESIFGLAKDERPLPPVWPGSHVLDEITHPDHCECPTCSPWSGTRVVL